MKFILIKSQIGFQSLLRLIYIPQPASSLSIFLLNNQIWSRMMATSQHSAVTLLLTTSVGLDNNGIFTIYIWELRITKIFLIYPLWLRIWPNTPMVSSPIWNLSGARVDLSVCTNITQQFGRVSACSEYWHLLYQNKHFIQTLWDPIWLHYDKLILMLLKIRNINLQTFHLPSHPHLSIKQTQIPGPGSLTCV